MPSLLTTPTSLPSVERAKAAAAHLEQRVRWDPDATTLDADTAAIVQAYAEGKLVAVESDE